MSVERYCVNIHTLDSYTFKKSCSVLDLAFWQTLIKQKTTELEYSQGRLFSSLWAQCICTTSTNTFTTFTGFHKTLQRTSAYEHQTAIKSLIFEIFQKSFWHLNVINVNFYNIVILLVIISLNYEKYSKKKKNNVLWNNDQCVKNWCLYDLCSLRSNLPKDLQDDSTFNHPYY